MHDFIEEKNGVITGRQFANGAPLYWRIWPRERAPADILKRWGAGTAQSQTLDREELRRFSFRRGPGRVLGVLVNLKHLDEFMAHLTGEFVEVRPVASDNGAQGLMASDANQIGALASSVVRVPEPDAEFSQCIVATAEWIRENSEVGQRVRQWLDLVLDPPREPGILDWDRRKEIAERCPSFEPTPVLWFDDHGRGPSVVEVQFQARRFQSPGDMGIDERQVMNLTPVSIHLPDTIMAGGGVMDLEHAKKLRASLDAAIRWAEETS